MYPRGVLDEEDRGRGREGVVGVCGASRSARGDEGPRGPGNERPALEIRRRSMVKRLP